MLINNTLFLINFKKNQINKRYLNIYRLLLVLVNN